MCSHPLQSRVSDSPIKLTAASTSDLSSEKLAGSVAASGAAQLNHTRGSWEIPPELHNKRHTVQRTVSSITSTVIYTATQRVS